MTARCTVWLAIAIVGVAGCDTGTAGSGWTRRQRTPPTPAEDLSGPFLGTWSGTMSGTVGGEDVPGEPETVSVTRLGPNRVAVSAFCPDATTVTANVLGPALLSALPASCAPVAQGSCPSVVVSWSAGTGILAGDELWLAFEGTMSGCGQSYPLELLFTSGGVQVPIEPIVISTLTPASALAGDPGFVLSVSGSGFAADATVTWNGSARPTAFVSATALRATIAPADLARGGLVPVAVSNPGGGTSAPATFTVVNPAPTLAALAPSSALAGDPSMVVTLTGAGFVPDSIAAWNGSDRATGFVSPTTLRVTILAADLAAAGTAAVTVRNPAPGGGSSDPAIFSLSNPAPTAAVVSPASAAPGDPRLTLTVVGTGFVVGTAVRWNGAVRPTTVVSSTVLHASIDAEDVATTGSAEVSLLTPPPGGGAASAGTFAIAPRPALLPQAVAYQIDPAHTGRAELGAPLSFPADPAWVVTLSDSASYPLIAGGKAFLLTRGSSSGWYGTQLVALDLATGAIAWGPTEIPGTYFWSGHAYEDGKIFVLDYDGRLQSFDAATGAAGWSVDLPYASGCSSAPTATGGTIYVGSSSWNLFAVDERDGAIRWTASALSADHSSPAIALDGLFVSHTCEVSKLDLLTGSKIWQATSGCSGGGGRTTAYDLGRLYVRDPYSAGSGVPEGTVYDAFDGRLLRDFGSSSWPWSPIPALGANASFLVSHGELTASDGAGTLLWTFAGDGVLSSAPLAIGDVVVVGSSAGTLYAIDAATGAQVWSGSAGASIPAPDEHNNSAPLTGLGAGEGWLVVPAGRRITGWRLVAP